MKFYKSKWFWTPLIIFFIIGILLQIMVSKGLAENTSNAPPGSIGGLIAGLFFGFFLWFVFGKIDKIKIPEDVSGGFEIPIALISANDNQKVHLSSSINPKLIIFPNKFRYKIAFSEKEKKYSDIEKLDILTGWISRNNPVNVISRMRLKWGHAMNINLTLKDKNNLSFNLHRKDNLIELLKFFKNKKVPLSKDAIEFLNNSA